MPMIEGKQLSKAEAQAVLVERRLHRPTQIDNASLYAGSPMYYYCTSCGHLSDVKAEGWFITPPKKLCGFCESMKDCGWLE